MTPKSLLINAVDPALTFLETVGVKSDDRARVLLMAIAGQESAWESRLQVPVAYARGFWQFEGGPMSGLAQVMKVASGKAIAVCFECHVPYRQESIFEAIAWHDFLAASMARLLLWQDPRALPAVGEQQAAWQYYQSTWHPGAPHPEVWPARYGTAMGLLK